MCSSWNTIAFQTEKPLSDCPFLSNYLFSLSFLLFYSPIEIHGTNVALAPNAVQKSV